MASPEIFPRCLVLLNTYYCEMPTLTSARSDLPFLNTSGQKPRDALSLGKCPVNRWRTGGIVCDKDNVLKLPVFIPRAR